MNVCTGPPTSIRDLALAIGTAAGRRVAVKHGAALLMVLNPETGPSGGQLFRAL